MRKKVSNLCRQPFQPKSLLHYTSYMVIKKYEKAMGDFPSGLYFNKVMSLCNRKLKKSSIDIKLPHYWYRYGDQVFRGTMPRNIMWDHESPAETKVVWRGNDLEIIQNEPYILIEEITDKSTETYKDDINKTIQDVYQTAPFEFQKKFLNLREIFYGRRFAFNWDNDAYKTISKPIITETFSTFPKNDFPELGGMYAIVNEFIEFSLEEDWSFNLLQNVCTNFWFFFCYYLRLHKDSYENISKETLSIWEEKLEFENYRYRKIIGDLIIKYANKHSNILKNKLLKEEYKWRKADRKEAKQIIDECVQFTNKNM